MLSAMASTVPSQRALAVDITPPSAVINPTAHALRRNSVLARTEAVAMPLAPVPPTLSAALVRNAPALVARKWLPVPRQKVAGRRSSSAAIPASVRIAAAKWEKMASAAIPANVQTAVVSRRQAVTNVQKMLPRTHRSASRVVTAARAACATRVVPVGNPVATATKIAADSANALTPHSKSNVCCRSTTTSHSQK